jgi:hypothetical protein
MPSLLAVVHMAFQKCIKPSSKKNLIASNTKVSSHGLEQANGCHPHSSYPKKMVECDGFLISGHSTRSSSARCIIYHGFRTLFLGALIISTSPRLTSPCSTTPLNLMSLAKTCALYALLSVGVKQSPDVAQEIMEDLFRGLDEVDVYIDDVGCFNNNWESHLEMLHKI